MEIHWIPTDENEVDIFTKNLDVATYQKHAEKYVGHDEYML